MADGVARSVYDLSDEEIMNMSTPPAAVAGASDQKPEGQEQEQQLQQEEQQEQVEETELTEAEKQAAAADEEEQEQQQDPVVPDPNAESDPHAEASATPGTSTPAKEPAKEEKPAAPGSEQKPGTEAEKPATTETPAQAVNYEQMYKQIMAPLRANGKTIELKSPEEAVQLMQMGANYTKKMHAIQGHRKVLLMLENNGLLDEGKLSFLIDLEKRNPDAIKKLVKDSGIDPMEIDVEAESTYRAGNHQVSDAEATFVSAVEDIQSTPGGNETLQHINADWDRASKDELLKNPELLNTIHTQRGNGIYERIQAEVNRLKTLGTIPTHVPFVYAYQEVGTALDKQGAFADLVKPKPAPAAQTPADKQPVATSTAKPKTPAANANKANAASPARSTPGKATPIVNPLAMSDDEFMKSFEGRL